MKLIVITTVLFLSTLSIQANPPITLAQQTAGVLVEAVEGFEIMYPELNFVLFMDDNGPHIRCSKEQRNSVGGSGEMTISFSMEFIKNGLKEGNQTLMNDVCEQVMSQLERFGFLHYVKMKRGIYEA